MSAEKESLLLEDYESCWIAIPSLKSIYVFSAPNQFEVYSHGDELHDHNLDIRIPIDELFVS